MVFMAFFKMIFFRILKEKILINYVKQIPFMGGYPNKYRNASKFFDQVGS